MSSTDPNFLHVPVCRADSVYSSITRYSDGAGNQSASVFSTPAVGTAVAGQFNWLGKLRQPMRP